jgi:predicted acylesterase/phospholipase RssA
MKKEKRMLRILSMDGGNGHNTAALLGKIPRLLPTPQEKTTFLNGVDLFAGTSDGGINALFFAKHADPTLALQEINAFWEDVLQTMLPKKSWRPGRGLGILSGVASILSSKPMEDYFIEYFGSDTTLGDLKHEVFIVSFQLDNERPDRLRSWKPRFFTNSGEHAPDRLERVVDVALRTSALPIEMPIYQSESETGSGYVDGGVVANQPAMCVLAHALRKGAQLGDIQILSVGTGRNMLGGPSYLDPKFHDGRAAWGYRQWLFDTKRPLVLLDIFLQAGMEAVTIQCRELLRESFFRLEPTLQNGQVVDDDNTFLQLEAAARWIQKSDWPVEAPQEALVAAT